MSRGRAVASTATLFELLNLGSPDSTDWMLDAVCAQTDPEVFFPEPGHPTRSAKAVCASCPVRTECLEDALARRDFFGVRGGLSAQERRVVAQQRQAGADLGAAA